MYAAFTRPAPWRLQCPTRSPSPVNVPKEAKWRTRRVYDSLRDWKAQRVSKPASQPKHPLSPTNRLNRFGQETCGFEPPSAFRTVFRLPNDRVVVSGTTPRLSGGGGGGGVDTELHPPCHLEMSYRGKPIERLQTRRPSSRGKPNAVSGPLSNAISISGGVIGPNKYSPHKPGNRHRPETTSPPPPVPLKTVRSFSLTICTGRFKASRRNLPNYAPPGRSRDPYREFNFELSAEAVEAPYVFDVPLRPAGAGQGRRKTASFERFRHGVVLEAAQANLWLRPGEKLNELATFAVSAKFVKDLNP